jgi:hypothetical protein
MPHVNKHMYDRNSVSWIYALIYVRIDACRQRSRRVGHDARSGLSTLLSTLLIPGPHRTVFDGRDSQRQDSLEPPKNSQKFWRRLG